MMTTLYKRDAKGAMRFWSIEAEDDQLFIEFGQVGGETQEQIEDVLPNEFRDVDEQVQSRMQSRINSKKDKGYVEDIELAKTKKDTNLLGYPKPMLAIKFDNVKYDIDYENAGYQYKYDGHRCLITNDGGRLVAYSRNGKPIESIDHIIKDISIPEGVTLDGELYCHGKKLQTISSWVKRKQADTLNLRFHVYDLIADESYNDRLKMLYKCSLGSNASIVPTFKLAGSVKHMLQESISKGYEGLIIRPQGFGYEDGKRSKGLIKVKQFIDDEYRVVAIHSSRDEWAILECDMGNGKTFRVSAPGTLGLKRYVLANKADFVGRKIKVEYANLTKDGVPFHPVATMWRDKNAE